MMKHLKIAGLLLLVFLVLPCLAHATPTPTPSPTPSATPTPTSTATPTATPTPLAVCDCVQNSVSTGGAAVQGSWVSCSTDYRNGCQVTMPKYVKHLEFQNQCSNTSYVQFNGVAAASGQGLALYTVSASVGNTIYDVAQKSPAAIAPPGTTTGILLVPTGPLSLISDTSACTHQLNILVY